MLFQRGYYSIQIALFKSRFILLIEMLRYSCDFDSIAVLNITLSLLNAQSETLLYENKGTENVSVPLSFLFVATLPYCFGGSFIRF